MVQRQFHVFLGMVVLWATVGVVPVAAQSLPDLVSLIESISTTEVVPGGQTTVTVRVSNIGSAGSTASKLSFRLAPPKKAGKLLLVSKVAPIAAGRSLSIVETLTVPTTTAPGPYTLQVSADSTHIVVERSEANNNTTAAMSVVAAPPPPPPTMTKHSGPVFAGQHAWAGDPAVLRDGTLLRMFYTCPDWMTERGAICHATSTDGLSWSNVTTASPMEGLVLGGALGTWAETLETAAIVKTSSEYLLFYSGYNETVPFPSSGFAAVGMSRSTDGVTFTPVSSPVLATTPEGLDNDAVFSPTVVQDGSTFVMLYAGHCYSACPGGASVSILGATSADGVTWTKVGTPILAANPALAWMSGGASEPAVVQGPDGAYYLFFTGMEALSDARHIGVGRSLSPLGPWEVYREAIVSSSPGTFDEAAVLGPTGLIEGEMVRLWYLGESTAGEYAIGYAESSWAWLRALFPTP
jgi:predicted GH43/DUF377 family glycosyl hydrolase